MDVRQVRPADAPLALTLALDDAAHLVRDADWPASHLTMRTVVQTAVPLASSGRAWIARDELGTGLLEARPRRYVIAWDVTRLAIRGDREVMTGPLIAAATTYLQSRGVPRLFARCRREESDLLHEYGFIVLAREYVLTRASEEASEAIPLPVETRYRMPQDAWPLHQLENDTTPASIRQLQGLSSSDWTHAGKGMVEIVVERDGHVVAWIGFGAKPRSGYVAISLLVQAGCRAVGPDLLQHALSQAPHGAQLLTRVRDYQVETLSMFEDEGFQIVAEETLLVKHAEVEMARAQNRKLRVSRVAATWPPVPVKIVWQDEGQKATNCQDVVGA